MSAPNPRGRTAAQKTRQWLKEAQTWQREHTRLLSGKGGSWVATLRVADIAQWLRALAHHWEQVLRDGPILEWEASMLRDCRDKYGRDPFPYARAHLTLVVGELYRKLVVAFGDDLDLVQLSDAKLEIKPAASGRTDYNGEQFDWVVDGSVQITGTASRGMKRVKIVTLFVTHPFHQYRAIPISFA